MDRVRLWVIEEGMAQTVQGVTVLTDMGTRVVLRAFPGGYIVVSGLDSRVLVSGRERPILLVDDDADIRAVVRLVLRRDGLPTIEAGSGDEAVILATHLVPRAVVLDLELPSCSGEEIAARLRTLYPDGLPIVVLSGRLDASEIAARIGAVACLEKPFNVSDLLAAVHRAVSISPGRGDRPRRGSPPGAPPTAQVLGGAAARRVGAA